MCIRDSTIALSAEKLLDNMKVVSVANVFGSAISRVHKGESVSALFEF